MLRALSKCLLNTDRLRASTTSLGSLSQGLTTLSLKKCFLTSSLNLSWCSFEPFPHVLSLDTREKRSSSFPDSPFPAAGEFSVPLCLIPSRVMDQCLKSHWDPPGAEACRTETAHLALQMDESSPRVLPWLEVSMGTRMLLLLWERTAWPRGHPEHRVHRYCRISGTARGFTGSWRCRPDP